MAKPVSRPAFWMAKVRRKLLPPASSSSRLTSFISGNWETPHRGLYHTQNDIYAQLTVLCRSDSCLVDLLGLFLVIAVELVLVLQQRCFLSWDKPIRS